MIFHEQEGLKLIARSLNQTNSSDELDSKTFNLRIFNEVNFTDSAQAVEKNEFDFTKDLDIRDNSDNQLESCFLFKGALSNINNVFDKKVWSRSTEDFLSLPQPWISDIQDCLWVLFKLEFCYQMKYNKWRQT